MLNSPNRIILDLNNVYEYLLCKKLVHKKSIVDGNFLAVDISRKNKNIKIISDTNYFIKQPYITDDYSVDSINRESKFYKFIFLEKRLKSIQQTMPSLIDFESQNNILITELLDKISFATDLDVYTNQLNILATTIASIHSVDLNLIQETLSSFLPLSFPKTLFIRKPSPEIFTLLSLGMLEFLKHIQQNSVLFELLINLETMWKNQTLIHGDLKHDNVIFMSDTNTKNMTCKIIDWELVDIGDPAWDISLILHDFLYGNLIEYVDNLEDENFEETCDTFEMILADTCNIFSSFWNSYSKSLTTTLIDSDFHIRVLKYAVAKLLQTMFDGLQNYTSVSDKEFFVLRFTEYVLEDLNKTKSKLFLQDDDV